MSTMEHGQRRKLWKALRGSCDIFTQPKEHKFEFGYMLFNFVFPVSLISQAVANKPN